MAERHGPTGLAGAIFGIIVFLIGVGLLALAFKLAYDMFTVDPVVVFKPKQGEALDLGQVVPSLMGVVVRVLLLLVMSTVGGMIANRGIRLYADARSPAPKAE